MRSYIGHTIAVLLAAALLTLAVITLFAPIAVPAPLPASSFATPSAAAAGDTVTITLREALRIAQEKNVALLQSRNSAALDDVDVRRARLQFLPSLSASSSASRTFGTREPSSARSLSAGASSSLTLFDGFGNIASARSASLARSAGRADVVRAKETAAFTVASNFLALVQQEEQLFVQREALAASQSLARQIREYVSAGAKTIADQYQQEAIVAGDQLAVVEADRAWQVAQADLVQTLQLDPARAYAFEWPAVALDTLASDAAPLDRLLSRAWTRRADLDAVDARVAASRQNVRVAGAASWPSLDANAGYGSSYSSNATGAVSDQFDDSRGGSVGLSLSLPLFDRGAASSATKRARIEADGAVLAQADARQSVGVEVRRAWLDLRAAGEQLRAAQVQLRAATQSLEVSQARYASGAATLVELAQARAIRVQAASAVVSGRYNLLFQRVRMDYDVGESDPTASLVR